MPVGAGQRADAKQYRAGDKSSMSGKLMIQGTMSSAGKSLVTAGILRVLKQDGLRVAPFKSQNMALNSYVTREGREIGRAQAMQAEAAGTEPEVAMNPILLKPDSDTGSQVIVNGLVYADMSAKEYFAHKRKLIPQIMEAFHTLEEKCDAIVIEGAGSPAEINLKQDDIVNMGLAELVDAPVLLVADIDRGGVFAQIYGTVMLLSPEERARIKGIIINKFRGDKALLQPGIDQIEELCGIPVIGVLPYLKIDIDDEDSVSERLNRQRFLRRGSERKIGEQPDPGLSVKEGTVQTDSGPVETQNGTGDMIRIAVVRLPYISNYTDFAPLENEPETELIYTNLTEEIMKADAVILPGSKNTIGDLKWLKEYGLDAVIRRAAEKGAVICGICGGYQMLGEKIIAEDGIPITGLRLLPVETVFCEEKALKRVSGETCRIRGKMEMLGGLKVEGYEIHMGRTVPAEDAGQSETTSAHVIQEDQPQHGSSFVILTDQDGKEYADGCVQENVFGTYLHGLFDLDTFRRSFLEMLGKNVNGGTDKGRRAEDRFITEGNSGAEDRSLYRESQYDKLAEAIHKHLDMERIRGLLNSGV